MKKILALILTSVMLFTFSACAGKKTETQKPENSTETGFVKPENYTTVIKLSINPEFNIYLDKDNKVLAVEALNDDAKKVKEKLTDTQTVISDFVKELITATNDAGFVKENAHINVTVTEIKDQTINTETLLNDTKTAIEQKTTELKVAITIETKVEIDKEPENEETNTESNTQTSSKDKPTASTPSIYHLYMTSTFNQDGSINFDVIAADCIQFFEDKKYLVNSEDGIIFDYEYPEKVIYDRIVKKYVFSDADWKAFKAKGSYNLNGPETATYENGKFKYRRVDAWGGGEPVTYTILETSNDKKGKLEIYYEVTPAESTPYKVRVRYQYDKKYANTKYEIIKPNNQYYFGAISSENKDFINSIKVAKVIESPINNVTYEHDGISIMFYLYNSRPSYIACYGFSGGTPEFACGCNFNGETNPSWSFNSQTKEARCPCGKTVLKNPFIDIVHW